MNCEQAQHCLMELERMDRPPNVVRDHLADCPACGEWQARLLQLEENVPLLPVPHRAARLDLYRRLLIPERVAGDGWRAAGEEEPVSPVPDPSPATHHPPPTTREEPALPPLVAIPPNWEADLRGGRKRWSARQLWSMAAGMAASILVLAAVWWGARQGSDGDRLAVPKKPLPLTDTLLASVVQDYATLAVAEQPVERVKGLAELAKNLHKETLALVPGANAGDLQVLAKLYTQVVRTGLLTSAGALPAGQRQALLKPIADDLFQAGREAEAKAKELAPASGVPLEQIARAARDGDNDLRKLIEKAVP